MIQICKVVLYYKAQVFKVIPPPTPRSFVIMRYSKDIEPRFNSSGERKEQNRACSMKIDRIRYHPNCYISPSQFQCLTILSKSYLLKVLMPSVKLSKYLKYFTFQKLFYSRIKKVIAICSKTLLSFLNKHFKLLYIPLPEPESEECTGLPVKNTWVC